MKNLLIIAKQRSGTTGLTAALNSDIRIKGLGEIFHPIHRIGGADNFVNYLGMLSMEVISENVFCRRNLFRRYLADTITRHANLHLVLDVKYNSLRNADQSFMNIYGIPDILLEWTSNQWPILWLKRDNKLKGIISHEFAMNTGRWHSVLGDSSYETEFVNNTERLHLNCKSVKDQLYGWVDEDELVGRWVSLLPRNLVIELKYEDIYLNGQINKCKLNDIYDAIGLTPPDAIVTRTRKVLPENPWGLIANFSELKSIFSGSEYEWMLNG